MLYILERDRERERERERGEREKEEKERERERKRTDLVWQMQLMIIKGYGCLGNFSQIYFYIPEIFKTTFKTDF